MQSPPNGEDFSAFERDVASEFCNQEYYEFLHDPTKDIASDTTKEHNINYAQNRLDLKIMKCVKACVFMKTVDSATIADSLTFGTLTPCDGGERSLECDIAQLVYVKAESAKVLFKSFINPKTNLPYDFDDANAICKRVYKGDIGTIVLLGKKIETQSQIII